MRLNIYSTHYPNAFTRTATLFLLFTLSLNQSAWANVRDKALNDINNFFSPHSTESYAVTKAGNYGARLVDKHSNTSLSKASAVTGPTLQARWNISHGPWTYGNSIDVCKGTKIVFSGNPNPTGGTYKWTGPNGFSSTSAEPYIIDIQPNEAGSYTLVYTVSGQSASISFSVTVRNPTVSLGSDKTTCSGSSVAITSSVTGSTGPYTYTWSTGSTASSITVSPTSTTTYSLTVTDSKGCTGSDNITVNVNPKPVLECEARVEGVWQTLSGCSVSVCTGADLALSVNPQVSTVTWTGPGGFSATGNDAFITSSYTAAKAGSYTATLTDANGCTSSKTISVSTSTSGPTLQARWNISHGPWTYGNSISVCKGTKIVFSGNPTPTGGTYNWSGPAGFSSTSAEPYIIDIQPSEAGTYTLEYTKDGCTATISFSVSVGEVSVNLGADKTNCIGSNVTISSSVTGGTTPYTYAWSTGATSSSITVSPSSNTTYTLTVTDSKGCNDSDDIIVTALPKPTATTSNKTICAGSSTTLTVSASGGTAPYTYLWSNGATGTSTSVSPTSTSTYTVTVTDSKGCSDTDNAVVTVNPKPTLNVSSVDCALNLQTYSVSLTTTGTQVTSTAGTVTNNGSGSYTISNIPSGTNITITSTITTTGCKLDVPVTAPSCICPTVNPPVSGGNKVICTGQTIPALTVTVGLLTTVDWYSASAGGTLLQSGSLSYTPTAAGTYYAEARNTAHGCKSTSRTAVTLTINPKPTANISGSDYVCPSQSITLVASGGGTYNWSTGSTSSSISVSSAGTYTVTVTSNGCTDSKSQTVSQGAAVNAAVTKDMDWTCTSGDMPATLTATPTGANYSYAWSSGAVPVAGTNMAKVAEAGQFFVTVTNTTTGCTGVANVTVIEDKTAPSASLSASNEISCVNPSATLTALPNGMQYQWSAGATPIAGTNKATVTAPGNYTVTVTNPANGCSNIAVTNVQQSNLGSITASISGNNTICTGGSVTLTASATGTGPFTYLWSNDATTSSITVSPTGNVNYSVTVTSGGCSDAESILVTVNPKPNANAGSDQTICSGTSASLGASASGGASPYTYAWSNGASTANTSVNPTSTTTYTVTVTDNKGCTDTESMVVAVNPKPTANAGSNQAICAGTSAQLSASASGGTAPYNYAWSNGANTASTTVSPATTTTYTVTVTDSKGCTHTDQVVVSISPSLNADAGTDQEICAGSSASLSASVSGGTAPYTYSWSNGSTSASTSVSPTSNTTYTVTITDSKGCTGTDAVAVKVNPKPTANAGSNQAICAGTSAQLSASASGGTAPYNYAWSNGANTASTTVSPATTTTYTVTVTDSKGCTHTDQVVVSISPSLNADAGTDQEICAGSSASLSASVSGGTAPYTYSWSNGANSASTSVSPTSNTTYTVTITDSKGCTGTDAVAVKVNPKPTADAGSNQSICAGTSAQLSASASGGTAPYNYAWSNGANTAGTSVSPATTTTYTVTVTDSKGCTHTDQVVVSISPSLNADAGTDQEICAGSSASLSASVSGGTAPYTYSWSNGANSASTSVSPTSNTTYTVTITDSKGCTGTDAVAVKVYPKPTADAGSNQSICAGTSAQLSASASGGTAPYNYAWSNGANTAGTSVSPATTTTYTVTVTDSKGCTHTDQVVVSISPSLNANAGTDQEICAGSSASLSASVSGGTAPYTYSWSNGATSASTSVSPTSNTTYTVTITDSKGCTGTDAVAVKVNPKPTANAGSNQAICAGTSAQLSASASGGAAPYNYAWSNGANTASTTVSPATTTTYTVTVTDSKGCTHTDQVVVTVNSKPNADAGADRAICAEGSIDLLVSATSGTFPYTYAWSNGTTTANNTVSPATSTTYSVTVTDSKGCTDVDQVVVTVNPKPVANAGSDQSICAGSSAQLGASASGGSSPYSYSWSNGANTANTSVNPATATTYTVTVTDNKGCTSTDQVVVSINPNLNANAGTDQAICTGASASLSATVSGGTAPYTYNWSSGATTANTTVSPGSTTTYSVTITDSKGCTGVDQVVVTVNPKPNANAGTDQAICAGASASLSASATSGTAPYSYAWSNGANTASTSASPATTTTYTVTVTDSKGCTDTDNMVVTVTPKPNADAGTDQSICAGATASLSASATSGTAPYSYAWSNGANTASTSVSPSSTTTYTVTVTDSKGCTDTDNMVVTVTPKPNADAGTDQSICAGTSAALSASATGGTAPYSYAWSNGANTASTSVSPSNTTTYTVTVTDNKGCTDTDNMVVTVNPKPTANAGDDQTICVGSSASLSASASGGTAPYSYSWSNGANTANTSVSPSSNTTYSVTVTDSKGCSHTDQVVVSVNPKPSVDLGSDKTICSGLSTSFTASVSGGQAPYSYSWNNGATTAGITVSPANTFTYIVTVTDSRGCSNTDQVTLNINQSPVANAGPDQNGCEGTTFTINGKATGGTTPYAFAWSTGANTATINVSPTVATTYVLTVTDANGCVHTDEMNVSVYPKPKANAGNDQAICFGTSATLVATANNGQLPYSFLWSTGATTASTTVSPSSTATYTVTVTDNRGCSDVDQIVVNVNPLPVVNLGADRAICRNQSTSIVATVSNGMAPFSYQWSSSQTSASINVSPTATTTYSVTVTDAKGCVDVDDIIITVNPLPNADAGPDRVVCAGTSTSLTATGGISFLWSTGATTGSITVTPSNSTTYTVTVTDINGCQATDQAVVTVNPIPSANAGADKVVCSGENVTLSASASGGTPGYSFFWSTGQNSSSVVVTPTTTTTYLVTVTDSKGCEGVDQVVVTVNPKPAANAGPDQANCAGTTFTLNGKVTGGTAPHSFAWSNGSNTADISVTPLSTTTYTLTVTDANGCKGIDEAVVTVYKSPAANAGPDQSICYGQSAILNATANDGLPPYSFAWNTGASSATLTVSPTQNTTYTVTITDNRGCFGVDHTVISINPLPAVNAGADQSICLGQSASLSASASAGTPGYTYAWSNGSNTASITVSPVTTTTYTVTATDSKGCTAVDQVVVTVNPTPSANAGADQVICAGQTANLSATGSAGTPGYTYRWSNGANTASTSVSPGSTTTYTVTVTDSKGCTAVDQVVVTVNPAPVANAGSDQTICNGATVNLSASASGGTTPYTYNWSNGANTASTSVSPTATTTYTVTVTDGKGCLDTDEMVVTVNPNPVASAGSDKFICVGASINITASASGGMGAYTYNWSNGATTASTSVSPTTTTTYTVTVSDSKGCTDTDEVVVTVNPKPTVDLNLAANAPGEICVGGSTSITTSVSGGTAPYTFSWSNGLGNQASHTVSPTSTTTYSVTVTDNNGCGNSDNITIVVNPLPVGNAGVDKAICQGETTSLNASASGGTAPYSYAWSNGATTASTSVSPASTTTYSVTVTDAKGCQDADDLVLTINPNPTLTITKVECAPNLLTYTITLTSNGTQITASSGTVTNTGANTYTVSGIASGVNITITASFATNCKTDASVNAPNCSCPTVTPPVSGGDKVICAVETIPTLSASVGANTTVDWYNAAGNLLQSNSLTYTPTAAGTYYAEARNTVNGCVSSTRTPITLTINPQPIANAGPDQAICLGNSASLQASANSGTAPYSYKWSSGQSTAAISVSPGSTTTYSVTVTDSKGCSHIDEVVVTVNPLPVANAGQDQEVCFGTQANLAASASNGTAPYTYAWSLGLGAGANKQVTLSSTTTFEVTVTDSKGCTDTDEVTVTVNPLPVANAGPDQEICAGLSANLLASASAGTAPFNYKWSSGQSSAGINVSPNTTTTYTVTVTDAKGCTAVDQVVVKVNPAVVANAGPDQEICAGSTAALSASGSNGTSPYTYKWSSGQSTSNINVSPATTTTYTVTVTDSKGCEDIDEVVVKVNPNPIANAGPDQAICAGTNASLSASASSGTGAYTYKWSNGATTASTTVSPSTSTTYTVTVTDAKGCEDIDEVAITINPNLIVNAGTDPTICAGATQGLTATVSSGTPAFSYNWSSGQTTASISVSPATTTTYTVTVTDSKGCTGTDQVVVIVNPKPSVSLGQDQEICAGTSTTLTASPSGGTPAYTYAWNTGGTTASITASPVATATYTVTITDSNGCVAQDDAVVKVNPNPIANAGPDQEICNGSSASLSATASSGTAPYTYKWSNGATTASNSVAPSSTTTYTVTVTDSKGCIDTDELVITVNPNPVANAGTDATICEGESTRLRASASSGTPSYSFNWSNGLGTGVQHDVSPATTTTYTVTVTDSKGCSSTDQVVVRVNDAPVASAGNDATICIGGSTTLQATVTQGTPAYTYLWSTGATTASITVSPTANTTYTVTVTDANLCSDVDEVAVKVNPLPNLTVSNKLCAPNLLTYTVSINTNADVVETTAGTVVNAGAGSFNITNIATGQNIVITVTNSQTGCKTNLSVTAPDCSCPVVNAPVSGGNQNICEGGALPALTVTVKNGETADWYNASGTLLLSGSTSYTPSAAGTYYAEARNTTTNCKSATRTAVSLSIRPATPSANIANGAVCSEDSPHTLTSDHSINLNSLITSGYTGGTWSTSTPGINLSGAEFTATKALEGQTVTFTYKIAGVDGPGDGNCNDRVYTVSVSVNSCYAKLGDLVWEDDNRNGIQDGGERLIGGVTVKLYNISNTLIATTTTNVNGEYLFDYLYPNTYIVEFGKPSGYEPTTQNVGNDANDSDAGTNGRTGTYTLSVGEENLTVDAGFYRPASLGDYVWFDQNGNGTQDGNEPGIPGVTVTLYADTNKDGTPDGAALKSTTTNGSGRYEFTNLIPGTYIVNFGKPSGYDPVTPDQGNDAIDSDANPTTGNSGSITLVSGQHNPTIDAGFGQYDLALRKGLNSGTPGPFTQGSTVKFDIRVTNEGSVAAKNVVVTDRFPTGLNFSGIEPGSSGAINNGNGVVTIPSINPGQTITFTIVSTIAANFQGSSLTNEAEITTDDGNDKDSTPNNDTPSEDDQDDETILINQQGRIDVEKLVNNRDADLAPGVTIFVPDAGATVTWTYVVTNTGTLNLTNINVVDDKEGPVCTIAALAPGQSSTCTLSRPAKLGPYVNEATATGQPVDNTNTPVGPPVSDKDPANYTGVYINIDKEADKTLVCAGERVEFSLTMRMKGGAPGFQFRNVSVTDNNLPNTLTPASSSFRSSSDTNGNGFLDFGEEFVWVYRMEVNSTLTNTATDMAEVWAPDADNPSLIVKVGEIGASDQVTVEVSNTQCAELGDYVWEDLDTDGVQDNTEKGVPGVTVKLYNSSNNQVGADVTDANGRYLFTGLVPETYRVEFVLPTGYIRTNANQGSDDALDSDANTTTGQTGTYPLSSGESNLTVDAGIYRNAQLGDRVWEDLDTDGVQDDNEPSIPGVTVKLLDSNGSTLATDITDENGLYKFTDLKPGTYTVMVNIPGGYTPTGQNQGGDDTKDSDINPSGMTGPIVLKSGDDDNTNDAGFYRAAKIGDFVWLDTDKDGVQDADEKGVEGVTVRLTSNRFAGQETTTTDANGMYMFSNLRPGDYQVEFVLPNGYTRSTSNQGGDDTKDSDADASTGKTGTYTLVSGQYNSTVDAGIYPSVVCAINAVVSNVTCDNKGTATPSDDTYSFTLTVMGSNASAGWKASIFGQEVTGTYGQAITIGPRLISLGGGQFTVSDANDAACTSSTSVTAPLPCSTPSDLTLAKSFVSATAQSNGSYNVVYTITVNAPVGSLSSTYDLSDQPAFDNDVTINSASYTSSVAAGGNLTGTGPWTLANDQAISGGQTHTYTLTVNVSLRLTDTAGDNIYTKCGQATPNAPKAGEGLFNRALLDVNNDGTPDKEATACGDLPECQLTAQVSNVVCDNKGTATPSDDTYSFTLTVNGSNASAGWKATIFGQQVTGSYGQAVVVGPRLISLGGGQFTVTDASNSACSASASVTAPVPCSTPSDLTLVKTFVNATAQPNGSYNVVYNIAVSAPAGSLATTYDLSDQPAFDNDVVINSAAFASTVSAGGNLTGTGPWTLANDQAISGGQTHTYTLTVNVSLRLTDTAGDNIYTKCGQSAPGAPKAGEGLFNRALLDVNNDGTPDKEATACGDLPECQLTAQVSNVTCDNKGTATPSDDTYSFSLIVTGSNASTGWKGTIFGQQVSGSYGQSVSVGPILISQGGGQFTVTDANNSACTASASVVAPTACSQLPCEIKAVVSEVSCDGLGTKDTLDDVYTFRMLVTGTGTDWEATINGKVIEGNYNKVVVLGPYKISAGALSFSVKDADNANCVTDPITVFPPKPCSGNNEPCNIGQAELLNVVCNPMGTLSDPSDDTYTFELKISGSSSTNRWVAADGKNTTGTYGQVVKFGPFLIKDGDQTFLISDAGNPECKATVYVPVPKACSNECAVKAEVKNILCNNNGTPENNDDDTFTFELTVTGNNASTGWIANDPNLTTGEYGKTVVMGPYRIKTNATVKFGIFDQLRFNSCTTEVTVTAPAACSSVPKCEIVTKIQNAKCSSNGTPDDPSDDTFTFEVIVTGKNAGNKGWKADDNKRSIGDYGQVVKFGPYRIADGQVSFKVRDAQDTTCYTLLLVGVPDECSKTCAIKATVVDVKVDNKGTADPKDDTFTFTVKVDGRHSSAAWTANDGTLSPIRGFYGTTLEFGPYLVSGGAKTVNFRDLLDAECRTAVTVEPPVNQGLPECPEDIDLVRKTRTGQIFTGNLDTSDKNFSDLGKECWLPKFALPAGKRYYETQTFSTDTARKQKYTFVLLTNMLTTDKVPGVPAGAPDAHGAVFLGNEYDRALACGDVALPCNNPLSYEVLEGTLRLVVPGYPSETWKMAMQFSAELDSNSTYTLLATTLSPEKTGGYVWVVYNEVTGKHLVLNPATRQPYPSQALVFERDILCSDLSEIFNVAESMEYLGKPKKTESCAEIDEVTIKDRLLSGGECAADTIVREFTIYHVDSTINYCSQLILVAKPSFEHLSQPLCNYTFECNELDKIKLDRNGNPHPQVTGYPFVVSAFGNHNLDSTYCNLKATYRDSIVDVVCAGSYVIRRTWSITDKCYPDSILHFEQHIKVGDFTAPVVECAVGKEYCYCPSVGTDVMMFSADPFDCAANIEAPLPLVKDACSDSLYIVTEILKINSQVIRNSQGQAIDTVETTVVIDTLLPGENRKLIGYNFGDYYFRYTVTDGCGNQTLKLCRFRVADLEAPIAICIDKPNFSLGSSGLARAYVRHIDWGSYDNCGIAKINVRRLHIYDTQTGEKLDRPYYSAWGPYVEFNCYDAQGDGLVEVEMEVIDSSGNRNMCWTRVLVEDKIAPICGSLADKTMDCAALPIGFNPFDIKRLEQIFGIAQVQDNCEGTARELTPIVGKTKEGYCLITRRFIAKDIHGNVSRDTFKQRIVLTTKNGSLCEVCDAKPFVNGVVRTEWGEPVEFVEIYLSGDEQKDMKTNIKGKYEFSPLKPNHHYTITPLYDDGHRNGLSTLDAYLIQRYLLGENTLNSPYKLLAADVDNNGKITSMDIVELRRLIMADMDFFKSNTSWRFVDSTYRFANIKAPWKEAYPEVIGIDNLERALLGLNFVGIKVGDVNESVQPNSNTAATPRSMGSNFELKALDQYLKAGNTYEVALSAADLAKLKGYQFTLEFDPTALQLADVVYGLAKTENISVRHAGQGMITTSWNALQGLASNSGALFTLKFKAIADGQLSDLLKISSKLTQAEAYDENLETMNVKLKFDALSTTKPEFVLYQNAPNPFNEATIVRFHLSQPAAGSMRFFDAQGRMLYTVDGEFKRGLNEVSVTRENLQGASGLLLYTLEVDGKMVTKKMNVLK